MTYPQQPPATAQQIEDARTMPRESELSHIATLQRVNADEFPDGGPTAWRVLLGTFCVFFSTFGLCNSVGVFQTYYVTQGLPEYSSSSISWIISFMLWVLNFLPIFWGFVFDRYGTRWLLIGGSLVYIFGIMMVSVSSKYWHFFLAQGLVCPIGGSAVNTAGISSVVTWFHQRRALAFGIMLSGSSIGGVVLPIMLTRLISSVGFAWAVRAVGLIFALLLTIACLTIRSRLPPSARSVDLGAYVRGIREPAMISTVFGLFLVFWGLFLPYNFVLLQASAQGMEKSLLTYLIPILHGAGLIGRCISGILADKIGRYNMIIILAFLSGASSLALWVPIRNDEGVLAFMAVFGLLSSGISSIGPALIAQISDIREIGARTGTAFAFQSFGLLTGNPIASAIVDATGGDYMGLQLLCGLSIFMSGIVFAFARHVQAGFTMRKC